MLNIIAGVVGALLVGGPLIGVLPIPGYCAMKEPVQFTTGIGLLVKRVAL
ncbi:hypothetical protein [Leucobacter sp. gxy201]